VNVLGIEVMASGHEQSTTVKSLMFVLVDCQFCQLLKTVVCILSMQELSSYLRMLTKACAVVYIIKLSP
jgi:hypothetical protein